MGAYHTGSWFLSTDGGAVLWTALARMAGGLCTLVWGLLSARIGTVSGAALPVVVGWEPSQCGRLPRWLFPWLRSRCPAVSLSNRCSGSELVCLCVNVCVLCVWVCMSLCLSGYLWGWEGWYVLSLLFLASVRHFVLLLKYERWHKNIDKII